MMTLRTVVALAALALARPSLAALAVPASVEDLTRTSDVVASLPPAPVVEPKHPARTPMMTRAEQDWTVFISDSFSRKSGDFRPPFTQRALHLVLPRTRTRPS